MTEDSLFCPFCSPFETLNKICSQEFIANPPLGASYSQLPFPSTALPTEDININQNLLEYSVCQLMVSELL